MPKSDVSEIDSRPRDVLITRLYENEHSKTENDVERSLTSSQDRSATRRRRFPVLLSKVEHMGIPKRATSQDYLQRRWKLLHLLEGALILGLPPRERTRAAAARKGVKLISMENQKWF